MGWIGCVRFEKFRCDFVARTFGLVRPVLHRVSWVNQTVPNASKLYEMHQNMSLGSNGVQWVRSLRKIPIQIRGTNFCTSLARFAPSLVTQPKGHKCTQILWNAPKHLFRVQWGGSGAFVAKNSSTTSCMNICINCTSLALLHQVSCSSETVQNTPEWKEMHQNMSLGSNSVDWECSLPKILTRHRGLNFCINCTSLARFARSFVQ